MADFDHESLEYSVGDPLEKDILDSARDDVPPPEAREQLLAALHLAPSSGSTERPSPWRAAGAPHARLVGLALALGAGAAVVFSNSGPAPQPPAEVGASSPMVAATAPLEPIAPKETQEPIAAPEEAPSPEPSQQPAPARTMPPSVREDAVASGAERAGHAARRPSTAPSSRGADAPAESTLGRELARVTAARSALAAGEAARSLQMLDAYDAEFPVGAFSVEVAVLRIEALARSGHADEARRLGNRFLVQHPEGLFARRVATTLRSVALAPHDPLTPAR